MKVEYELSTGQFDVQDEHGASVASSYGGPWSKKEHADTVVRMQNAFDAVLTRIEEINTELRRTVNGAQV